MIFGLKKIPHRLIFMSYDDVETPTALIGKKLAPILHLSGEAPMPESLDIIKRIDDDSRWGPPILQASSGREDLKLFEKKHWPLMRLLIHTRLLHAYVPDLVFRSARDYFIDQHPIQGPSGEERPNIELWRSWEPSLRRSWYQQHFEKRHLVETLSQELLEAEPLIHHEAHVSPGGLSYDDVMFFGRVRYLPLIDGLQMGPKLHQYIQVMSEQTEIPLLSRTAR
ncbi:Glutaredoxin 2 (Grx2) [Durusdinium trenchii]